MESDSVHNSSLFGDLSTQEVTSKIILTAIIVLSIALLFVLILHLYAKLYWWRIDHLQQQQQDEELSIAPPPVLPRRRFIFVPGQDYSISSNTGLSSYELSCLPIVLFKQGDGTLECAICLSELVKGDKSRMLPKCKHSFHVECIDMWFHSHSTCPICRNTVLVGPNQVDNLSQTSPEFPTNVLVWGRQDQVISRRNTNVDVNQEAVVLEINQNVPRLVVEEEEEKFPMTTRLRSLRRFLSRDKLSGSASSSSTSPNVATSFVDP